MTRYDVMRYYKTQHDTTRHDYDCETKQLHSTIGYHAILKILIFYTTSQCSPKHIYDYIFTFIWGHICAIYVHNYVERYSDIFMTMFVCLYEYLYPYMDIIAIY